MKPLDPLAVELQGTHLVEASAGTGKTHAITTLYVRLLLERALPVERILVVTYTNAATSELRARIRRRLLEALAALRGSAVHDPALRQLIERRRAAANAARDEARLLAAVHAFDEAAIFTIHGFCQRMLQEHAFESGVPFDAELLTNQRLLVTQVTQDFWVRELHAAPLPLVRALRGRDLRLDLGGLERLATLVLTHPDIAVLPAREALAATDVTSALQAWQSAYTAVVQAWQQHGSAVVDLLCECGALKENMYQPARMRSAWPAKMDAELASELPGIADRKPFYRFTTTGLREGLRKRGVAPQHPFFHACDSLADADARLGQLLHIHHLNLRLDFVDYARREMRRRKEESRLQSFDDLLARLVDALRSRGGGTLAGHIRQRFHAALIDEFQDTDSVQYEIFRRIYAAPAQAAAADASLASSPASAAPRHDARAGGKHVARAQLAFGFVPGAAAAAPSTGEHTALFLIGDPKQAIYAFRGADVFAYVAAKHDADAAHTLATNWRSDPSLVGAVNAVFGRARQPFVLAEIPFQQVDVPAAARDQLTASDASIHAPLQFLFVHRSGQESNDGAINKDWQPQVTKAVAADIVRFLGSGARLGERLVQPADIAVLCRTNAQATEMQVALRDLGVPSVLQSEASVFEMPQAVEVQRVLRAVAEPSNSAAVRAALATSLFGLDATALQALQTDEPAWDRWLQAFQEWNQLWIARGFVAALHRLLDSQQVPARLLAWFDGERRLTNVLHLLELLHGASVSGRYGPAALVHWLHQMRNDAAKRIELPGDAAQIRLESDDAAVKLVTIHKSKGLQYPVVYCPYLWDGSSLHLEDRDMPRFHDPEHADRLSLDLGSPQQAQHCELAEREALAENLRLLYVALTRAQHGCRVVWGAFRSAPTSALGYLLHQPAHADAVDLPAATAARIAAFLKGGSDEPMLADLQAVAAAAPGCIEVTPLVASPVARWEGPRNVPAAIECRELKRRLAPIWRTASYSSLIVSGALSEPAAEGIDDDAVAAPSTPAATPVGPLIVLHQFPAGARSGRLIHSIFEHLDFQRADAATLDALVKGTLAAFGLEERWAEVLCRSVNDVLDTPLNRDDAVLRLREVGLEQRLNELEFIFPVATAAPDVETRLLTAKRLAAAFEAAGPPLPSDYADRLANLGFGPLAGYLKGYVDLVFEHDGRWYVVDYKSNLLGVTADAYEPAGLATVMTAHHYYLQYHLYVVALHRFLNSRLPGYDYERHFGGIYYLFVRGMAPQHRAGCGVYADRPSRQLVERLSAILGGLVS